VNRARCQLAAAVTALLLVPLAGCSPEETTSGNTGYVSGKGIITTLDPADRVKPEPVSGVTIDGDPISLTDFTGKTVVINVWGSWCSPCRSEADDLVAAEAELSDDNVAFLGINSRDLNEAAARAFVRRYKIPYPSIYDQQGETLLAFDNTLSPTSIPSTLVIDEQGRVAASILGELTKATLVGVVQEVQRAG